MRPILPLPRDTFYEFPFAHHQKARLASFIMPISSADSLPRIERHHHDAFGHQRQVYGDPLN